MKTIKSISEAFSMQPSMIKVGDDLGAWDDPRIVKRIEFVPMTQDVLKVEGYDKNDKVMFTYIASAVNIHYF